MLLVLDRAHPCVVPTRACAHLPDRARSLRAMHRLLRVDSRRALACPRPDHIQSMLHGSRCARPPGPCTRQLHPQSKIRSLSFQPTPARALHCSNSPAHTRMFWARDDRGRKPASPPPSLAAVAPASRQALTHTHFPANILMLAFPNYRAATRGFGDCARYACMCSFSPATVWPLFCFTTIGYRSTRTHRGRRGDRTRARP
jgi:hypothetical protein